MIAHPHRIPAFVIACLLLAMVYQHSTAQPAPSGTVGTAGTAQRLAVVWTSGDPDVAHRMVLMYLHASKKSGWFPENRLVVWGPSARLLAGDKDLQAKIRSMMADGVVVEACVACADSYGVSERLRELGIPVKPMGKPLSDMIKDGYHILTF